MSKLKAAQRNSLPSSEFGMPKERKYPMPDKNHARVAKSYASKEVHAGKLSASAAAKIRAKADRMLGK
jgi:hypothetical protein